MTIPEFLSFVECPTCHLHVGVKRLSSHDCPISQSHRFSQISFYDDQIDLIPKQPEMYYRPTLPEILNERKRISLESKKTNKCCRCHRDNASVLLGDSYYHPNCFNCFYCRIPFNGNTPHVFENQLYCTKHHRVAISRPSCSSCKKPIESFVRPTEAFGQYFHPEHLRCFHCHKSIDPIMTGIKERKGKIYCQTDFNNLFLPKCQACHRAVEREAVLSLDGKLKGNWHKHCFKCQMCDLPFPNNRFYIYNNAPYCKLDYHKLNNSICHSCSLPIEGDCAETTNVWRFHPNCFVCHTCKSPIQSKYAMSNDGNTIYCEKHTN